MLRPEHPIVLAGTMPPRGTVPPGHDDRAVADLEEDGAVSRDHRAQRRAREIARADAGPGSTRRDPAAQPRQPCENEGAIDRGDAALAAGRAEVVEEQLDRQTRAFLGAAGAAPAVAPRRPKNRAAPAGLADAAGPRHPARPGALF